MTDNIRRMYELMNIEKKSHCDHTCDSRYFCSTNCTHYNEKIEVYPPFTAEKQLELIKYFSENIDFLELSHNGEEFEFYTSGSRTRNKDFSQALASFIYYKWDDLTDEQKEEVRGILQ